MSAETDVASIERWAGVTPPNAAARVALEDYAALLAELERLRGGLVFEMEPADFNAALLECREPRR